MKGGTPPRLKTSNRLTTASTPHRLDLRGHTHENLLLFYSYHRLAQVGFPVRVSVGAPFCIAPGGMVREHNTD
jgi:hypothetical protein